MDAGARTLVADLQHLVTEQLSQRMGRMFEGADDMLFEMAKRAINNEEQRVFFDTMRVVRINRPAITRTFSEEVAAGFAPDAVIEKKAETREISFEEVSLRESKSVEETIAVSNMIAKAENLYERPLWEIGRRMDSLINAHRAPISKLALSPTLFCNAFRQSAEALNVDFQIELLIYKLFDKLVVAELGDMYAAVLKFFDQHAIKAAALAPAVVRVGARGGGGGNGAAAQTNGTEAPAGMQAGMDADHGMAVDPGAMMQMPGMVPQQSYMMPGGAPAAMPMGMPAGGMPVGMSAGGMPVGMSAGAPMNMPMPVLDPHTLGTLRMVRTMPLLGAGAGVPAGHAMHIQPVYGDPELAADLASAARGDQVEGWSVPQAFSYIQRTNLVGQMFNGILEDPNLPENLKPRFDDLRFAVIKSALKDASFFANPKHPVRGLVNELATMAASARATGMESIKRIEDLVAKIQSQFGEAAQTVKAASEDKAPLPDSDIDKFLDEQLVQSKARRQALVEKSRRVVQEEMHLRLVGHSLPESAKALLDSGWAPMMALRLLRHGMDSEQWREGIMLLQRIIHSLDPNMKSALSQGERDELFADIEDDFLGAGMPQRQIRDQLMGLRKALEVSDQQRQRQAESVQELAKAAPVTPDTTTAEMGPAVKAVLAKLHQTPTETRATASKPAPPPIPVVENTLPNEPGALLDSLLVPGGWFKVHDHERRESRWLKVIAHYQEDDRPAYRDAVAFAEFNGKNTLLVKTDQLLKDMSAGLAEPFDQSPTIKKSMSTLLELLRSKAAKA